MPDLQHNYTPGASAKDDVRMQIRDVGPTNWHLADEEIDRFLVRAGGSGEAQIIMACALACEAIAAKYADSAGTFSEGGLSMTNLHVYEAWKDRAKQFREQATMGAASAASVRVGWTDRDLDSLDSMTGRRAWTLDHTEPSA